MRNKSAAAANPNPVAMSRPMIPLIIPLAVLSKECSAVYMPLQRDK